jgi:uncharacterized protein
MGMGNILFLIKSVIKNKIRHTNKACITARSRLYRMPIRNCRCLSDTEPTLGTKMQAAMTERFEMRFDQGTLDAIDAWRSRLDDLPSRAEAIRRLVNLGLGDPTDKKEIKITDGEKLILGVMAEIHAHLKVKGELDPDFIMNTIHGGHYWGLDWKYPGIFHRHEDSGRNVSEVVDILDMWSFVESSYAALSAKDKARIEQDAKPFGKNPRFHGFDGNNETEHMGIAHFLIQKLERFSSFEGRNLNAHMPSLDTHRRMLGVFEPMRRNLMGRTLTAGELIEILNEITHPEHRRPKASSPG